MNELTDHQRFVRNIVERYADMVLRIAYQNLKNKADAEDVTQEVFVRLVQANALEDEEHVKAWLIRVAINLCKDFRKTAWFRKRTSLTTDWQPFSEEQQNLLEELWRLPSKDCNIIYLYYYEGYSVPEIARILHKNENTLSSQLSRARKKLKCLLVEGGYEHA